MTTMRNGVIKGQATRESQQNDYDVIVIGSGMGGLTTASLLAQLAKKRVLLLERHFKPGGFTHSFKRHKYEWDVGVHYVGQMQAGAMARRIMNLVTRNGVQWHAMGSPLERMSFAEGEFEIPVGESKFRERLIERFPHERTSITKYFRDVRRAQSWMARWFISKQYHPAVARAMTWPGRQLAEMTTSDYFATFRDPLLRGVLTGQWPDFGTPPSRSAFGFHALIAADYFDGGFYPIGGASRIAEHAIAAVEAKGGKCLVNHEVKEIVITQGKTEGVIAEHKGKEIRFNAPVVVSNAGAMTTFDKLVDSNFASVERERLGCLVPGPSANVLFLGLKQDPRVVGIADLNHWLYRFLDHDDKAKYRDGEPHRVDSAFVSFGSLRNPGQTPHTAQIISMCRWEDWKGFEGTTWKRRGEAYEDLKQTIGNRMLDFANERIPGLKSIVEYQELSTPLTVESFTGHWKGVVYGQECDPDRLDEGSWSVGTSVRGLYLTGSDVGSPGINGALMAGVMTAGKLLGLFGMTRVMTKAMMSFR